MILLFLTGLLTATHADNVISVYGDVYKDVEFFKRTFPWIIDNIGGEIYVNYYLVGSGRYAVPQMCALQELNLNTFLQAQYLKCEAEENPSEYCLCESGIDPKAFKECVASGGYLASLASANFSQLSIDITPIIELQPNSTVFGVDDIWYLKKICTIFGDKLPRGCIKPFACNQSETFPQKKSLAQFDRACRKKYPIICDDGVADDNDETESPVTTTEWTTAETPWWTTTGETPWWSPQPTPPPTYDAALGI